MDNPIFIALILVVGFVIYKFITVGYEDSHYGVNRFTHKRERIPKPKREPVSLSQIVINVGATLLAIAAVLFWLGLFFAAVQ